MGVKEPTPRELFLPAEMEEHIREHAPEFLARAVESAAKRGFAVEYKAVSALKAPDCYDCGFCHRLRYLKSEWHCRIFKPDEAPNPCAYFHHRSQVPNCLECESWCLNDPRCMNPRSQWAGLITSPNNYCRFFERRPPENAEQTPDSQKSTGVAILPSLANCPGRDYYPDMLAGAAYTNYAPDTRAGVAFSAGGLIALAGPPKKIAPREMIVPADQLRRVLTTSNAADMVAAYIAQADEDAPASWTGTENRPPGACIGGQTPFNGKYYYYVWFEEPPTEGETNEQKTGPQPPTRQTGRHEEAGTPGLYHCPKSPYWKTKRCILPTLPPQSPKWPPPFARPWFSC